MAFVSKPFAKNQQSNQSGAISAPGVVGADGQPQQQPQSPVSSWTNLDNFIKGNQGSGEAMAGTMTAQADADITAANQAGNQFVSDSDKEQGKVKTDTWSGVFNNGNVMNLSDDQKKNYKDWQGQSYYQGEKDLSKLGSYGAYGEAAGKAQREGDRSFGWDNQNGLAKDYLGKGNSNYNAGMSMLDTLLTRQAGGQGKLESIQNQAKDGAIKGRVGTTLSSEQGQTQSLIDDKAGKGAALNRNAGAALNAGIDRAVSGIDSRIADANKRANDSLDMQASTPYQDVASRTNASLGRGDVATDAEMAAINSLIDLGGKGVSWNKGTKGEVVLKDKPQPASTAAPKQPLQDSVNVLEAGANTVGAVDQAGTDTVDSASGSHPLDLNIMDTVTSLPENTVKALKKLKF